MVRVSIDQLMKSSNSKQSFIISAKKVVPDQDKVYQDELEYLLNRAGII